MSISEEAGIRATVTPIKGGTSLGAGNMPGQEPIRRPYGVPCGRCGSNYTVLEVYTDEEDDEGLTVQEVWCRLCGTELDREGNMMPKFWGETGLQVDERGNIIW